MVKIKCNDHSHLTPLYPQQFYSCCNFYCEKATISLYKIKRVTGLKTFKAWILLKFLTLFPHLFLSWTFCCFTNYLNSIKNLLDIRIHKCISLWTDNWGIIFRTRMSRRDFSACNIQPMNFFFQPFISFAPFVSSFLFF